MKQAKTIKRKEVLTELNWLERKNKFNKMWDKQVKTMFNVSGSLSFEELVYNDLEAAEQLVVLFK